MVVLYILNSVFLCRINERNSGGPDPFLPDGLKYRKRISDSKLLSVSVQKLSGSFVSVISRHKKGHCAFGCKDRVIGNQRVASIVFPPANTRFNDQDTPLLVGQHGLHGGIRGIDNLPFLHDLQCIVKTDFACTNCSVRSAIVIQPLKS